MVTDIKVVISDFKKFLIGFSYCSTRLFVKILPLVDNLEFTSTSYCVGKLTLFPTKNPYFPTKTLSILTSDSQILPFTDI